MPGAGWHGAVTLSKLEGQTALWRGCRDKWKKRTRSVAHRGAAGGISGGDGTVPYLHCQNKLYAKQTKKRSVAQHHLRIWKTPPTQNSGRTAVGCHHPQQRVWERHRAGLLEPDHLASNPASAAYLLSHLRQVSQPLCLISFFI